MPSKPHPPPIETLPKQSTLRIQTNYDRQHPGEGTRPTPTNKRPSDTTVQPGPTSKKQPTPQPTIDQRSFGLKHNPTAVLLTPNIMDITSRINRALHQEGINDVRVDRICQTVSGRLLGTTTPLSTAETLLRHRDLPLRAARSVGSSIICSGPFEKWGWVKIHGASPPRYMEKGSGGLQKLREELEVENEGARAPSAARWLGGAGTRTRFRERRLLRPSVVLAVVGEAVAARLCKQGVRLAGLSHEAEPFEEARPDAFGRRCCAWGHVAPSARRQPPGAPSAGRAIRRSTTGVPSRGAASSGATRAHTRWPGTGAVRGHTSPGANVCLAKREARRFAKGWRSPSPPRRERRASAPPKDETPEGPATGMGEMEVEGQLGAEAGGGGMAE